MEVIAQFTYTAANGETFVSEEIVRSSDELDGIVAASAVARGDTLQVVCLDLDYCATVTR